MPTTETGRQVPPSSGVIPPLVTPFTDTGAVDFESLQRQASWLVSKGVDGVWLNGTTAEFHALSDEERTQAVKEVVSALKGTGCPVFAQVGAPATRLAVRLAESAVSAGADAVSAVLPYYFMYEQSEVKEYLRAIRRAAGVPLYLYQVPVMTKITASIPTLLELAGEGTLAGMKDSLGDVSLLRSLLVRANKAGVPLTVFVGDSALIDTSILAGAAGAITAAADVAPAHCLRVAAAALAGDWPAAQRMQADLVTFLNTLVLPARAPWTPRVAALKFIQAEMGIIADARCAEPFQPLDKAEQEQLRTTAIPLLAKLESAPAPA